MAPRDSQRSRLYAAERAALECAPLSPLAQRYLVRDLVHSGGYRYASMQSTQAYVDAVRTSAKFRRRWGHVSLTVGHNPLGSRGGYGVVNMSAQHRHNEWAILHEIAHNLSSFTAHAAHGPEFAATLLTLVDLFMGKEAAGRLREAYAAKGVKYRTGMARVPKPDAARLARAQRVKVTRATPGKPVTDEALAARKARRATPMTYEESYLSGWRSDFANGPSLRIQDRPGFDYRAWEDGALDAAAGRERYHLRDCKAHYNYGDGCGKA